MMDHLRSWVTLAASALAAVLATATLLATGRHGTYVIHAQFTDASQLIVGNRVEVGGEPVGSIKAIGLSPDGLASITLAISDPRFTPLHRGTTAYVALPGLASAASRYVDLEPGPQSAGVIPSGGILPSSSTRGAVDLDEVLDAFTPRVRRQLSALVRTGAEVLAPPTSQKFNLGLRYLNPALSQTAGLGRKLLADRSALTTLISSTAAVSTALARNQSTITGAITDTAALLDQVAGQAGTLRDALARAPSVLSRLQTLLGATGRTITSFDSTLRYLRPAAKPVASLLRTLAPVAVNAEPAIQQLGSLLPPAREALKAAAASAPGTATAANALASAINQLLPVVTGMRPYMPDVISGLFQGLSGSFGGSYDANGHYARIQFVLGQTAGLNSLVQSLPAGQLLGTRTGLTARCPGGAGVPAPDGSNPWIPQDDPGVCDPADDYQK